jgi:hypothetical protein
VTQGRAEKELAWRDYTSIDQDVRVINSALKAYARAHHGKIPDDVKELCPKYLADPKALWIRTRKADWHRGVRMILAPGGRYRDRQRKISYITFMSAPCSTHGDVADGRFVIDSNFYVWFVSESRFHSILAHEDQEPGG